MKKTFSYVLFTFMLSFLFVFFGNNVEAASSFWNEVGDYSLYEQDTGEKYAFNKDSESYNYNFEYSYSIDTTNYIFDNGVAISYFYGIKEDTAFTYRNIDGGFGFTVNDRMMVYKYNYTTKEFVFLDNSPAVNTAGTYTINEVGLYKLATDGVDGNSRNVYVVYEKTFYEATLKELKFDRANATLEFKAEVRDPRNLFRKASFESAKVDTNVSGWYTVTEATEFRVLQLTEAYDKYQIEGKFAINYDPNTGDYAVIKSGNIYITVEGGVISAKNVVKYDLMAPVINEVNYYNKDLYDTQLKTAVTGNPLVLPDNIIIELLISDDNQIVSVTSNIKTCSIGEVNAQGKVVAKCEMNNSTAQKITFQVQDVYGNNTILEHDVSHDSSVLDSGDELANYVSISGYNVEADFSSSSYTDLNKLCIVYGDDLTGVAKCGDTALVESTYYYNGSFLLVLLDNSSNYAVLRYDNQLLGEGYQLENFTFDVDGTRDEVDITDNIFALSDIVCNGAYFCISNEDYFVKYGDVVERLADIAAMTYELPSYLEILNQKFKDSTCVKGECNKSVEVYVEYQIGELTQKLSIIYNFADKLPYITDSININPISLEYGSFDINSDGVKQMLYGDDLEVTLEDAAGTEYIGKIVPRFVEYKDKNGNISAINDGKYDYIGTAKDLGYYTLECRVKLLSNRTTGLVYTDEIYTKSFFIVVTLDDTKIPTLTLLGDAEVEVKQNNAYKDAGYKCEDASTCVVTVKYYLDDEEVDRIDTRVAGKYIIKYSAVDTAGNASLELTRTVTVTGVDEVNASTIIIIVSIVVVFGAVIALAIIIEVRKNRKRREME